MDFDSIRWHLNYISEYTYILEKYLLLTFVWNTCFASFSGGFSMNLASCSVLTDFDKYVVDFPLCRGDHRVAISSPLFFNMSPRTLLIVPSWRDKNDNGICPPKSPNHEVVNIESISCKCYAPFGRLAEECIYTYSSAKPSAYRHICTWFNRSQSKPNYFLKKSTCSNDHIT